MNKNNLADFISRNLYFISGLAGHFDSEGAARLSLAANAERTLLIHFGTAAYTDMGTRLRAVQEAREIFPNLKIGRAHV